MKRLNPEEGAMVLNSDGDNGITAAGSATVLLAVPYDRSSKFRRAVFGTLGLLVLAMLVCSGIFVLHLLGLLCFVIAAVFLFDSLFTTQIIFAADRIVKQRWLFGEIVVPVRRAVMTRDQHFIRFCHGGTVNRSERITIQLSMISARERDAIGRVAAESYDIHLAKAGKGAGESTSLEGGATGRGRKVSSMLLDEFGGTVATYRYAAWFMLIFLAIGIITIGVSDDFAGVAPGLPAFWIRLVFIGLTLAAYPLLKRLNRAGDGGDDGSSLAEIAKLPWNQRFKGLDNSATFSATLIASIAFLGFLSLILFGNIIDLYLFLIVATVYYLDFYPRLSVWERVSEGRKEPSADSELTEPPLARRRSMQVSLVVMGVLAMGSYGQSQNYLYKSKKDCMDDWGSEQSCQEPQAGSRYYRTGYYYGPRYGTMFRSGSNHSVGVASVSRGGFGSLASFHGSHGG